MTNQNLTDLAAAGTSAWLDDLSRSRLDGGELDALVEELAVVGVTTNPAIFHTAMTAGDAYDAQLADLAREGADAAGAVFAMAVDDVRRACDALAPVHAASGGEDGRVSIEVDPRLADDGDATIAQARELWGRVGRDNAMIKIPATDAGLPAITEAIADGICVNVTLIFSVARYRQVVDAYLAGLERAREAGRDLSRIRSVASFFVSRVDTEIDARLAAIGTDAALALRGTAGLANARLAYAEFERAFSADDTRWAPLAAAGAAVQRPLWASTGVKNPEYPPTLYVTGLAGPHTVNTMPEKTLRATAEAELDAPISDTLTGSGAAAAAAMAALSDAGVDLDDVFAVLETEGVDKFVDSWRQLLDAIGATLESLR